MGSNLIWRLLMTTDLLTCLATIPDRRRAEGKIYGQAGVILFSILAMVSGARSYRQIHTLIDRRLGLLNAAFPGAALRGRPPTRRCVAFARGSAGPNWNRRSAVTPRGSIIQAQPHHRASLRSTARRFGAASMLSRTERRRMC